MGNIFDILGPVMVGPSSSHTAGAVRIGLIARQLFGRRPDKATVYLHGSFADTGKGHGTDKALIAGLLGMKPDDLRIPDSFRIAKEEGMEFTISPKDMRDAHPNTAQIIVVHCIFRYVRPGSAYDSSHLASPDFSAYILVVNYFDSQSIYRIHASVKRYFCRKISKKKRTPKRSLPSYYVSVTYPAAPGP